jgi:hypothetical protein
MELVCHIKGRTQTVGVENRILRGIIGTRRKEMIGGCVTLSTTNPT